MFGHQLALTTSKKMQLEEDWKGGSGEEADWCLFAVGQHCHHAGRVSYIHCTLRHCFPKDTSNCFRRCEYWKENSRRWLSVFLLTHASYVRTHMAGDDTKDSLAYLKTILKSIHPYRSSSKISGRTTEAPLY